MSLYDALKKLLAPEIMTQVEEALGDEFDYDVVPRSRLNKVIKQRNEARLLAKEPKDDGDDIDEPDNKEKPKGLSQKDLDKAVADAIALKDAEILNIKLADSAMQFLGSKDVSAIDPELIWNSKYIDKTKVTLDDKGTLVGLKEQVDALKTDKAVLFGKPSKANPGTGRGSKEDDDSKTPLDLELERAFNSFGVGPEETK